MFHNLCVKVLALGALALTTALDHNPNPTKDYEGYVTAPYQQSIISFVFEEEGQPSKIVPYSSDDCKDFQEGIRYLDEAYKHHIKIAFRAKNGLQGMLELEGCIHPTLDDHVK